MVEMVVADPSRQVIQPAFAIEDFHDALPVACKAGCRAGCSVTDPTPDQYRLERKVCVTFAKVSPVISNRLQSGQSRAHPKLKGRFPAKYPHELLVIVHEGGPRLTARRPEVVLVEVTGCDEEVFTGRVLQQPMQLHTLRLGQQIRFVVPAAPTYPVLVTEKYLQERRLWTIQPCRKCGFSELFDPPSELIPVLFPNSPPGASQTSFKSPCPICGGPQMVLAKTELHPPHATAGKRRAR